MQFTPTLLDAAEEYRNARDAYFDLDPDDPAVAATVECEDARRAYEHAGMLLAELTICEIDSREGK
jgi:hypothetical protein